MCSLLRLKLMPPRYQICWIAKPQKRRFLGLMLSLLQYKYFHWYLYKTRKSVVRSPYRISVISEEKMRQHKKLRGKEKQAAIIRAVFKREDCGHTTSIYAIATYMGYTPNGSFCKSVWECVDAGLLDARPVSHGNRFSWQLTVTAKALRSLGFGSWG